MSNQEDKKVNFISSNHDISIDNFDMIEEKIEIDGKPRKNVQEKQKIFSNYSNDSNINQYPEINNKCHNNGAISIQNGCLVEEVKLIRPLTEAQMIKQRNKIIDDYINDLDKERNSYAKLSKDEEEDMFSVSGVKNRLGKKNKDKDKQLKFHSNREKQLFNDGMSDYMKNERILSQNTTLHGNGKWNLPYYSEHHSKRAKSKHKVFSNNIDTNKKRNNTAKMVNKYNLGETHTGNMFRGTARVRSTFKPGKKLELKQNKMLFEMNNPKNPYSTNWTNKMLDKRYNMELCSNGFFNGVPIIKLNQKRDVFSQISKKQLKEDLDKYKTKYQPNDFEVNPEMEDQFNTNMKNFYKVRKDIQEESVENENDDCDEEKKQTLIEYPMIYNFFRK